MFCLEFSCVFQLSVSMRKVAGEHSFCVLICINSYIWHIDSVLFIFLSNTYLIFNLYAWRYQWPTHMELPNTHAHVHEDTHAHAHTKKTKKSRKSRKKRKVKNKKKMGGSGKKEGKEKRNNWKKKSKKNEKRRKMRQKGGEGKTKSGRGMGLGVEERGYRGG